MAACRREKQRVHVEEVDFAHWSGPVLSLREVDVGLAHTPELISLGSLGAPASDRLRGQVSPNLALLPHSRPDCLIGACLRPVAYEKGDRGTEGKNRHSQG